ncbi:hypothetical protein [Desulfovibrio gilichinskyi]|uniref:Polysaccharide deacetylase n=1 Tax=Desulfovibrio gilichinskyi TaxID=1519643 RepID=A0A1X7EM52_9BACT|nr:hypothetical protein [Desulfovibrio gilichinskyi]SMF36336.1 hypothetical protein SAMN06295933_3179 [Desulfovibrio gilichinskyi]
MKKKFLVLIEDDFEIMGNGLGNVADLQYLPALALMNIAEKYGVKLTFMVDVAHQLTLKKFCKHPEVKIQSKLWAETVQLMIERGFDVQLHLHPQWVNSVYKDGYFHLTDVWNIGRLLPEEQTALIADSVDYLESLLRQVRPEYDVCAFKGGAWGLQPSTHLMSELGKAGIHIIMGPCDGMVVKRQGLDYSGMEEKNLPYYPNHDDLTKIADASGKSVVIPLQSYSPDLLTFSKYIFNHIFSGLISKSPLRYYHSGSIPADIRELKPLKGKNDFTLNLRPYRTHLKIGDQPFSYLKKSFDTVIGKLREYDAERIPVLIESHTKQYAQNYRDIERFIAYIAENYESEVEFGDMSGYSKELQDNPNLARSKK